MDMMTPRQHIKQALKTVSTIYHTKPEIVLSNSRNRNLIVPCRDHFVAHLRDNFGWSYPKIGRLLNRDHTTILAAYRRHYARTDPTSQEARKHAERCEYMREKYLEYSA